MPATTPKGYPYPLGTDRVMDGDDAIHALATAVDKKATVTGSGTFGAGLAAGASSTLAVTFPAGSFATPPTVLANAANARVICGPSGATATGVTIGVANWSSGSAPGFLLGWAAFSNDPI